jgi:hypothetical protein
VACYVDKWKIVGGQRRCLKCLCDLPDYQGFKKTRCTPAMISRWLIDLPLQPGETVDFGRCGSGTNPIPGAGDVDEPKPPKNMGEKCRQMPKADRAACHERNKVAAQNAAASLAMPTTIQTETNNYVKTAVDLLSSLAGTTNQVNATTKATAAAASMKPEGGGMGTILVIVAVAVGAYLWWKS